ncbi:flagellar basal body-associated FliL family protein [Hankyongella ginsenosidimutans]|nr:flagellar basal body-associated FliL family protein [Hankyongella ginsenosidimutans]
MTDMATGMGTDMATKEEICRQGRRTWRGRRAWRGRRGSATYVDLPEFLVNLRTTGSRASFLKLTISLEVSNPEEAKEIEAQMPRVIDGFQTYLRELRVEDLSGSAGLFRLKEELLRRINVTLAPARVDDVLFKEMLIQ